jgi:branched-chain amino acid transport system permease protein
MDVLLSQLLVNGIATASLFALAGVSWGIIYKTTRTFHYSHQLVFSVAGYASALVITQLRLHFIFGLIASILVATLLGCAIEAYLYRRLRGKGATQTTIFLGSLGLATAGIAILLVVFSSTPRPLEGFPVIMMSIGKANFTSADLMMVIVSWVLIGLLLLFLDKSSYGKAIRAVASNAEMSKNVGINIDKIYVLVFGIGSALFGAGAFLFAAKNVAFPTMGGLPFFMSFTAVFLGGVNSIVGAALAGFILGVAENLGMMIFPGEYKVMIVYAILFVVILIKPEGLLSSNRG